MIGIFKNFVRKFYKPLNKTQIYMYNKIKESVLAKGYKFFDVGDYNLNFIWNRVDYKITNKFTDFLYVLYRVNNIPTVLTIPATTKPGYYGSIDSPVTVDGITGTAIIKEGQYRGSWDFVDSYSGFSSYPYFKQVGLVDYYRDGDKDWVIDCDEGPDDDDGYKCVEQDNKLYYTHWHRMSQNGTYGSGLINNWSLGCIGSPEPEWIKILPIVRTSVLIYGKRFTGTIMLKEELGL
jgi:hypothetical protein